MKKKYGLLITICLLCCIAITGKLLGTLSVQASDSVVGDLNNDKNITEEDMNALRKHLTGEEAIPTDNLSNADVNGDTPADANENSIDVRDLVRYKRYLTPASEKLSGTGKEEDPYLISSVSDWYKFIEESQTGHLSGVYYQLTTDIEINIGNQSEWDSKKELLREWIPIGHGVESPYFDGYLLGDGHTVSGAYMQDKDITGLTNLFGYIAGYKRVQNLKLTNSNMHYISLKGERMSITGTVTDSTIRYTPFTYTEGAEVFQGSNYATNYQEACNNIIVTQLDDGTHWKVSNSTLVSCDASITIDDVTTYYETLKTAVNAANDNTTKGKAVVINVLDTAVVDTGLEIKRDITIQNVAGKDVSITRGKSFTSHMFQVTGANDEDAKFTLQAQKNEDGEGTLTIDGKSTGVVHGITVLNNSAKTTFDLKEGVTLQNANSDISGAALQNAGIANLSGNVCNNTSSAHGGAIRNTSTGTLNILGGNYSGNTSAKNGGVIYSNSTVNTSISIDNATFAGNTAAGGGTIYVDASTNVNITDSTFTDNCAIGTVAGQAGGGAIAFNNANVKVYDTVMENNSANHTVRGGAAICIMGVARAELTKCTFTNNATIPGGTCDIWFAGDQNQHIRLHDDSFTGIVGWMENLTKTTTNQVRRYVSGKNTESKTMTSGVRYQVSHDPLALTELPENAPDYSASTKAMNFYAHRSTSADDVTKKRFQEYKDCGFNVIYPQEKWWTFDTFGGSELETYMDLAAEVGLKYIVRDNRIKYYNNIEGGLVGEGKEFATIDALADKLQKYMAPYIHHPAFYGIALYDEPKAARLQTNADLSRALEIVGAREGVDIYIKSTLLPYNTSVAPEDYTGNNNILEEITGTSFDSYKTYISNYITASKCKILSYDDYPFLEDGFKAEYYQTLQYNANKGTGLEIVAQSCGYNNRRTPDLADLYLQNNAALAFGVKQMGYFTYWRIDSTADQTVHSGILNSDGTKMLYDDVKAVIGYTQQMAKVILNFNYVKANFGYASGSKPNYFKGVTSETLEHVTATVTGPTIITQMHDSTNNRTGYMVVNVDSSHLENTAIDTVTLTFTDAKYVTKYSKSGTEIIKLNNGQLTLSLAEGEGAFLIPHN